MLPAHGRLAGVDYGTVRIGVSICDAERRLASPLENYTRRSAALDARYFRELAAAERIVGWVVGLPVHGSGDESAKSTEARAFGRWLAEQTQLPVVFFDERYTTAQADAALAEAGLTSKQRKARRDKLAAQFLLAAYLEASPADRERPRSLD